MADNIDRLRSLLYRSARLLGDLQAVRRGTLGRRIARRVIGGAMNRALMSLVPPSRKK